MIIYFLPIHLLSALAMLANVCVAVKMDPPSISAVKTSSFAATFSSRENATQYYVTVVPKHGNESKITLENYANGSEVSGLLSDKIYLVTVRATDDNGAVVGQESDPTVVHTLPLPPKLILKGALANSVYVFFDGKNLAQVSQWTIQYRKEGNASSLKTAVASGYMHWLSRLTPNTRYEIRARPSQLRGSQTVTEIEVEFPTWQQTFTTGRLSVFGRVDITNITYMEKIEVDSTKWNESLKILRENYKSVNSGLISLLRIENVSGIARVHYRVEVDDETLPSRTNYSLSSKGFVNSLINNGGAPNAKPYYYETKSPRSDKHTLIYASETSCPKIVERYFIITTKDKPTFEIHLNVASSDATTPEEDDGLEIEPFGDDSYQLKRDDAIAVATVPSNAELSLIPKFVVKDCLIGDPNNQSLYSELLYAKDVNDDMKAKSDITTTTDVISAGLNSSGIVYSHAQNWSYFVVEVPAIEKAIEYYISDSDSIVNGSLKEEDLDSSETWEITTTNHIHNTTYSLTPSIVFRRQDGSKYTVKGVPFPATPGGPSCDNCSSDAICSIRVGDGKTTCKCLDGFTGNGMTCDPTTTATELEITDGVDAQTIVIAIVVSIIGLMVVFFVVIYIRKRKKTGSHDIKQSAGEAMTLQVKQENEQTELRPDSEKCLNQDETA